jgi:hypothetical protein
MYCEIDLKHSRNITGAELVSILRARGLGAEIAVSTAFSWSALLRHSHPGGLFAHETFHRCFVILKSVTYNLSTYHLEGRDNTVSAGTLLEVAQEYVMGQILPALKDAKLKARPWAVRLFEDNGKETGLIGRLPRFKETFREQFNLNEIHSHVIVLFTAFFSLRLGMKTESVTAAIVGLSVATIYAALNGTLKYLWNRRKLSFGFPKG